jgi:hypothetical protein
MLAHQEVLGHGTRKDEDIRPGQLSCLLLGLLAVTTVGLSPTSRRQLTGHTSHC